MGEPDFFSAVHYLTLEKDTLSEDKNLLKDFSNFQVLMKVLEQSETKDKKDNIISLLSLLFPFCSVSMTPNSIVLINRESNSVSMIDNDSFDSFQEILKDVFCVKSLFGKDQIKYNPVNKRAEEIANKIYKGRQKVAQINAAKNKGSVLGKYLSVLTVGLYIPEPEHFTMFKVMDLIQRYGLKREADIDMQIRLAGGSPDSQPEEWTKDLYNE